MHAMTGAHPTLPLPAWVRVTNLQNGRSVVIRLNDRGPFSKNRIIDLSRAAAEQLDMVRDGTAWSRCAACRRAAPRRRAAGRDQRSIAQAGAFAEPGQRRAPGRAAARRRHRRRRRHRSACRWPAAVSRARRPGRERRRVRPADRAPARRRRRVAAPRAAVDECQPPATHEVTLRILLALCCFPHPPLARAARAARTTAACARRRTCLDPGRPGERPVRSPASIAGRARRAGEPDQADDRLRRVPCAEGRQARSSTPRCRSASAPGAPRARAPSSTSTRACRSKS